MNLNFYYQFRESLLNGSKIQTLRTRQIQHGKCVCLIVNPYSKTRRECLKVVNIVKSIPVWIDTDAKVVLYRGIPFTAEGVEQFAKNEGFATVGDFYFHISNHGMSKKNLFCCMWESFNYLQYLAI